MPKLNALFVGCSLIFVAASLFLGWFFFSTYGQFAELISPMISVLFHIGVLFMLAYVLLRANRGERASAILASQASLSILIAAIVFGEMAVYVAALVAVIGVVMLWMPSSKERYFDAKIKSNTPN
jgi:nitrate reductase gamma subunit